MGFFPSEKYSIKKFANQLLKVSKRFVFFKSSSYCFNKQFYFYYVPIFNPK